MEAGGSRVGRGEEDGGEEVGGERGGGLLLREIEKHARTRRVLHIK